MDNKNALIIFVRNVEYGKVKTRLAKGIGNDKALAVYRFLLNYTAEVASAVDYRRFVFYSEKIETDDCFNERHFTKLVQHGNDLGERMKNAFSHVFGLGFQQVCIIGSDCYELKRHHLEQAFSQLKQTNLVIGPAKDGGYYLLGMAKLFPTLFNKKSWGTDSVLQETMNEINRLNLSFYELPILNDIDTTEDLLATDLAAKLNLG